MGEAEHKGALVWQREALVNQIESTAMWRAQRAIDRPEEGRNEQASAALSELAARVARLDPGHALFAALAALADDLRASELISERLWRYGFDGDYEPAAFIEALAADLDAMRSA